LHRLGGEVTLLQAAALRASDLELFAAPTVIGSAALAYAVEAQLRECGVEPDSLILEPTPRNTAAAVALAAVEGGDALMLVMPSDHLVADVEAFRAAVRAGARAAREGWLVTFGIHPEYAETGYGYIERGEEIEPGVYRAERFVEKPDRATAETYVKDGRFAWNGGIFLFRADVMRAALAKHAPDVLGPVEMSLAGAERTGNLLRPEPCAFGRSRSESIDRAVMEKVDRVAVIPVRMGWSDVGSWDALYDAEGEPDADGNVCNGDVVAIDTRGTLVNSEGPLVVTIGIDDLIVVATGDAVLVARRGESQRVREAVDLLKARGVPAAF
jgi:mannose-1-phosphate guanylyltransferase/mannose-1-phosphate guanylyltransferase/mannose-6-phosphate isomerase